MLALQSEHMKIRSTSIYCIQQVTVTSSYGTAQAQRRTRLHTQLCLRFKKLLIEGCDNVAAVSLMKIASKTVAMPLN